MAVAPFKIADLELMTIPEIQGLLHLSYNGVCKMLRRLPDAAKIRGIGRGRRILVHSWALAKMLNLEVCPGCGRPWPTENP